MGVNTKVGYSWVIRRVFVGYSWGIRMYRVCVGYVSGMYRECNETYKKQIRSEFDKRGAKGCYLRMSKKSSTFARFLKTIQKNSTKNKEHT